MLLKIVGIFFVDIRRALAVVMHALVFNVPISDEYISTVFAKLKFSPGVFAEFVQVVRATSAMEDANVPLDTMLLIRSMSNFIFSILKVLTQFANMKAVQGLALLLQISCSLLLWLGY